MRVLMLNYEFPPLGGGAANANRYILEKMADIPGLEVDLVTSSEDEYREESFSDNINIYRLDVGKEEIHHWSQLEIMRYFFKGLIKCRELNKRREYDMVHAWFGFPCGLMASLLRKPYLVSLRGSDVPGYNERFSIQYIFLKPIIKRVWQRAEKVVANSQGLKDLARETSDIGIDVIPNGVDTEQFNPGDGKPGDTLRVICVARLTPRKRVNDLIQAIHELNSVKLTLIGEGEEEQSLKELVDNLDISDRVEFEGYVPHDELPDYYRQSDVFVLPSMNEGMSNTVLEAMASGLPIITTDTGGTAELIRENGIVISKKDPEAIRQALKEYMDSPEEIVEHGKNSRKRARELDWKSIADEYMEIYRDLSD